MASLAYSIRVLRLARGLTSAQLAAKARISPTYLSLIESGERCPPTDTLEKLASALKIDVELLIMLMPDRGAQPRSLRIKELMGALRRLADAELELKRKLG